MQELVALDVSSDLSGIRFRHPLMPRCRVSTPFETGFSGGGDAIQEIRVQVKRCSKGFLLEASKPRSNFSPGVRSSVVSM